MHFLGTKATIHLQVNSQLQQSKKYCTICVDKVKGKGIHLRIVNLLKSVFIVVNVTYLVPKTHVETVFIIECDVMMMVLVKKNNKLFLAYLSQIQRSCFFSVKKRSYYINIVYVAMCKMEEQRVP